jgi:NhaP-type Na+/H+ or K+/H+ antiporter
MVLIAAFALVVFLYSLVSRRLEGSMLTAPMLFTVAGGLTMLMPAAMREVALDRADMMLIAELGLVMTLFTDACRIDLRALRRDRRLALRLLGPGMLSTLVLGTVLAVLVLGGLSWWEAGILAAILAPTDAGLGQVIVESPKVPRRIRDALNVEAGLNDGLSVPFLLFFIVLAASGGRETDATLTGFLFEQLGYGTAVGVAVGLAGGWLISQAERRGWMAEPLAQLATVALPVACVLASEAVGASMFIAAFVAGLATQVGFREVGKHSVAFTEDWGRLFNLFVFFLFGLLVTRVWSDVTVPILLYAVLSLTVIRMLPVAVALWGTGLSRATVLFMGWFGPRGLASIVLGLAYLESEVDLPGGETIRLAVMATVLLSIIAHGVTASPGIALYARSLARLGDDAPERGTTEAARASGRDARSD